MQSGAMASRLSAVSSSVSPLLTLDDETLIFTASAERRFAASSNDVRVRVEDSKNRLMTVLPRRAGTFLTSRVEISLKVFGSVENAGYLRRRQVADAKQISPSKWLIHLREQTKKATSLVAS